MWGWTMRLFGRKKDAAEKKRRAMDGADTLSRHQTRGVELTGNIEKALTEAEHREIDLQRHDAAEGK